METHRSAAVAAGDDPHTAEVLGTIGALTDLARHRRQARSTRPHRVPVVS